MVALVITKADLHQALNALEKRIIANADAAHAAIGKRLDRIDDRLDKVDGRLGRIDGRLDNLERGMRNLENKLLAPQERTRL